MEVKLLAKICHGGIKIQEGHRKRSSNLGVRTERVVDLVCKAFGTAG